MTQEGRAPRRVLAVRVGRMGDLVMLTPALRLLLDGLPDAEVHLLTTGEGRRVLKGFDPRLAVFHLYHRKFPGHLIADPRLRRTLRAAAYDRIYVFESHRHYAKLVRGLAPEVYGLRVPPSSSHYSARCLDIVEPTLVRPTPRGWLQLPVTETGRRAADAYLEHHGVAAGETLVGLHVTFSETSRGAFGSQRGRKHREWPAAQAIEFARRLVESGRASGSTPRVVVDALPEERARADQLAAASGGVIQVLSGAPDFERYKALLARMRILVTPNTGPMHVAAAVGTPVVALFSGWSPAECGPFVPAGRSIVLRAEDEPGSDRGLEAISSSRVFEACRGILSGA